MNGAMWISAAAIVALAPAGGLAKRACVVLPDTGEPDAMLSALRIESKKAAAAWEWVRVATPSDCSAAAPLLTVGSSTVAHLRLPGGNVSRLTVLDASHSGAHRALARRVLRALSGRDGAGSAPTLLLEPDAPIRLAAQSPSVVGGGNSRARLVLRAGGGYVHQVDGARDLGGPALEAGVSLYDGQLAVSLTGAWLFGPATEVHGLLASVQVGELLALVRGGFRFGSVLLRAGAGGGWQRRTVTVTSEGPRGDVSASSDAGVLALDLEVMWRFATRWHAAALFTGRVHLGGGTHSWLGLPVYEAPGGAVGAQVVFGVTL